MTIKLRIPVYLFALGLVSGAFQLAAHNYQNASSLTQNLIFFLVIGFVLYTIEKTKISQKESHLALGVLLVLIGAAADYLMR